MTNGDRIRAMSDEELAEIFEGNCHYCSNNQFGEFIKCQEGCKEGIKAYLESEEEWMSEVKKCCLCDEELCCADDLFEYNGNLFCFDCLEMKLGKEKGLNTSLTTTYFDKENEYLGDDDDLEGLYETICRRYDVKRIRWEEE